jgi:hypothetical protein
MATEQQILANADEWYAYEMSRGLGPVLPMTKAQKDKVRGVVLAEVRVVLRCDEELLMDSVLDALRSGQVQPIVRLTDAQMEEIERGKWE